MAIGQKQGIPVLAGSRRYYFEAIKELR